MYQLLELQTQVVEVEDRELVMELQDQEQVVGLE
jgi:hypothetical protein